MATEDAGERVVIHDAHRDEPTTAFALSRLSHNPTGPTPIGIFRDVDRPVYDDLLRDQVQEAVGTKGEGRLTDLLASGNVWDVVN
jgi:2-oxoglutarate/2-oxoacid ferredoxin oxidoreductase subunit beta